jgi:hypothetical protein
VRDGHQRTAPSGDEDERHTDEPTPLHVAEPSGE